jgi:hypothetical protein
MTARYLDLGLSKYRLNSLNDETVCNKTLCYIRLWSDVACTLWRLCVTNLYASLNSWSREIRSLINRGLWRLKWWRVFLKTGIIYRGLRWERPFFTSLVGVFLVVTILWTTVQLDFFGEHGNLVIWVKIHIFLVVLHDTHLLHIFDWWLINNVWR